MVALLAKVEEKAQRNWEYMNEAMEAMTIDGDSLGYFCMVPSEEDFGFRYRVRFVQSRDGVVVTGCECLYRRCHASVACKHMEIVDAYFQWIDGLMALPIHDALVESVTLMATQDQTVAEHMIEEELTRYHKDLLFEAAHGISSLRMRARDAGLTGLSRAGKDQLIGSLMAWRRHTLVPSLSGNMPDSAMKVSGECPPDAELTRAQVIMRIREGLHTLAHLDEDYASEPNGMGFNGTDSEFGHDLATRHTLTDKQLLAAAKMLQKYNRTQLGGTVPPMAIVEKALNATTDISQKGSLGRNRGFSLMR